MSLVALGSLRSAATTTTALGLARTWPEQQRRALLVEVDPAGGTLGATLGLRSEPGLQSLAADARRGLVEGAPFAHAQSFGTTSVLLAPPAAEQMRAAYAMLGDLPALFGRVAKTTAAGAGAGGDGDVTGVDVLGVDVLCDCGRLDLASSVLPLFGAADVALLVARGELADFDVLVASMDRRGITTDRLGARLGLVLVGGPYGAAEVEEAVGVPVIGVLPHDPSGVRTLISEATRGLGWRSALPRAMRSLAEQLVARLTEPDASQLDVQVGLAEGREDSIGRENAPAVEATR